MSRTNIYPPSTDPTSPPKNIYLDFTSWKVAAIWSRESASRWSSSTFSPPEVTFNPADCTGGATKERQEENPTSEQAFCPVEERSKGGKSSHPQARCRCWTWRIRLCPEIQRGLLPEESEPAPAAVGRREGGASPGSRDTWCQRLLLVTHPGGLSEDVCH